MVDIPNSWHPQSRVIAERYSNEFKDRYPYWKDNLVTEGAIELQFIMHMADKLYDDAMKLERTDPEKAVMLYEEASNVYNQHIKVSGYLAASTGHLEYIGLTDFDLTRANMCAERSEILKNRNNITPKN